MKRAFAVVAVLVGTLVVTVPAEAASTSAEEGRKFSRKYMNQEDPTHGYGHWRQQQCYRIGRDGVGTYGLFPGGVACQFSATPRASRGCWLFAIAVKDGKRLKAQQVSQGAVAYRGDQADCDPGAPYPGVADELFWRRHRGPVVGRSSNAARARRDYRLGRKRSLCLCGRRPSTRRAILLQRSSNRAHAIHGSAGLGECLPRHPGALEVVRSAERDSVLEAVVLPVAVDVMDLERTHRSRSARRRRSLRTDCRRPRGCACAG